MSYIEMSYKGFTFPVNPASVQIRLNKKVSKTERPFFTAKAQVISEEPAVISGSGCFTGEKAAQNAYRLGLLFREEGAAYLFTPLAAPVKAYFTALEIKASAEKDCIAYTFSFTEDATGKRRFHAFPYTYALAGENLYQLANRCGVGVEEIVGHNNFKDLFSANEGDKVWLR